MIKNIQTSLRQEATISLPSLQELRSFLLWISLASLAFASIYGLTNYYTSTRSDLWHLYFGWEVSIAFIPSMIYIYLSLNLLFLFTAFVLRHPVVIAATAKSIIITLCLAVPIFLMFPAHLGFTRPDFVPGYQELYATLYSLDQPHNLVPSLHITFSFICIRAMVFVSASRVFHYIMMLWFLLICLSVVFVHQHHCLDVAAGYILGWFGYRFVFLRSVQKGFKARALKI